jgi:hypothetical protein
MHHKGAPDRLSRAYRGAFRGEHGRGRLGNDRTIWPHREGEFFALSLPTHLLTFSQIIAIVMDNASNNNTLMTSLERQCQQRGIPFSAQDARLQYMLHTIHLAAIKVLILSQLLCMHDV